MSKFEEINSLLANKKRCQMYAQFYKGSLTMDVLDFENIDAVITDKDNLTDFQLGQLSCLRGRLKQKLAFVRSTINHYENRIEAIDLEIVQKKRSLATSCVNTGLVRSSSAPELYKIA
jgi:hypothetical protein